MGAAWLTWPSDLDANRCRAILQPSTGYDMIDADAATEYGVVVINLPIQCVDEVANHAIAFVLATRLRPFGELRKERSRSSAPGWIFGRIEK